MRLRDKINKTFRLVWDACPAEVLVAFSLSTLAALMPPVTIWLSRQLVDVVAAAPLNPVHLHQWLPITILLGCTFAAQRFLQTLQLNRERSLAEQVARYADQRFLEKAQEADLSHLEDPKWHDRMARAARSLQSRPSNLVHGLVQVEGATVTALGIIAILFTLNPLIVILILAAVGLAIPQQRFQTREIYKLFFDQTTKERERFYFRSLLIDTRAAKEVRAYNLGDYLLDRHQALVDSWIEKFVAIMWRVARMAMVVGLLTAILVCAAYVFIVDRGITGHISPGSVTAAIISFSSLTTQLSVISTGLASVEENSKFLDDYFTFLAMPQLMITEEPVAQLLPKLSGGITFDSVTFRYPGTAKQALNGFNLHINDGELLALVGNNGAGKTTIIKLLLRYYDPDHGSVSVGGTNVRRIPPPELRAHFGVLFQDFILFQLTVRENVTFGDVNREATDEEIFAAINAAQVRPIVDRLPDGLDSMLGRLFEGGHDLSTGEQQRVALARLIFRDSDIWILDEPTSGLDAEAEMAVFAEFRKILANRIGIIVSHRFSTVRNADRIAVIDNGRVAELGTHDELIALGGQYMRLYELQASSYR